MDVLIVGGDTAVQEGLLQSIRSAGLRAASCADAQEARESATESPPLALVVHVDAAHGGNTPPQLPIRAGGAVVLFRDDAQSEASAPQAFGRTVVAQLVLPLERARLLALLSHLVGRARITGRDRRSDASPTA